jgi:predicted DNA-binding protein (MmcQ/YjbR family)
VEFAELRDYVLAKTGAYEEFPWNQSTFKVGGKIFVGMMGLGNAAMLKATPDQQQLLVQMDGVSAAPYLGHKGWILVDLDIVKDRELIMSAIDESYRQVVDTLPKSKRPMA